MTKEAKKEIFNKIILIFTIGCVFGTYYEELLHIVLSLIKTGTFSWASRRGLIYGPFCPVYGIGAVLVYLCFGFKERKWYKNFIYGALLGGAVEYFLSYFQELFFGTISWDYSKYFLNINGRTTIPFMVFWGLLVLGFIYGICPLINKWYAKMSHKVANRIALFLFVFLSFDISISVIAVNRQELRDNGVPPKTFVGRFCDKHYDDEYLARVYDNARPVNK